MTLAPRSKTTEAWLPQGSESKQSTIKTIAKLLLMAWGFHTCRETTQGIIYFQMTPWIWLSKKSGKLSSKIIKSSKSRSQIKLLSKWVRFLICMKSEISHHLLSKLARSKNSMKRRNKITMRTQLWCVRKIKLSTQFLLYQTIQRKVKVTMCRQKVLTAVTFLHMARNKDRVKI